MSKPAIRPLSEELQKVARDEVFETKDNIAGDLKLLKEWILQSPHLKVKIDDQHLIAIIRCCKHRIEIAKKKIDLGLTMKTHLPDIFDSEPFNEKSLAILKLGVILPLPKTASPAGPRVTLFRVGLIDLDHFRIQDVIKVTGMIAEILMMEDDNIAVSGLIHIIDLSNTHLDQLIPWFLSVPLKTHVKLVFEGLPIRIKHVHIINVSKGLNTFLSVFRSLLKKKMTSRVSSGGILLKLGLFKLNHYG